MIEKAKTDQPRSLEDTLLFAQHFYHTSEQDADTLAKQIQALVEPPQGKPYALSVTSQVELQNGRYRFEVQIKEQQGKTILTRVKAVGQIYEHHDTTVLEGKVLVGTDWYRSMLFLLIAILLILPLDPRMAPVPPIMRYIFALYCVGMVIHFGYITFNTRKILYERLEQIANTPAEEMKTS
jgi:hypothetical protein